MIELKEKPGWLLNGEELPVLLLEKAYSTSNQTAINSQITRTELLYRLYAASKKFPRLFSKYPNSSEYNQPKMEAAVDRLEEANVINFSTGNLVIKPVIHYKRLFGQAKKWRR